MPDKEEAATRHRMVVEEIDIPENTPKVVESDPPEKPQPDILDEGVKVSSQEVVEKGSMLGLRSDDADPQINKEKSPVFWILIPGLFILGAILGGVFFYQKGVNSTGTSPTPAPVASNVPATTPSPTPAAKIDVSKFDVAIFNGSGIAGEAGKVKTLLTVADFNVVSTANAATYDYKETIIKAKSTVDASVIQKVKDALSKNYVIGDNQTLAASSTTDIQIVVGSSKAE